MSNIAYMFGHGQWWVCWYGLMELIASGPSFMLHYPTLTSCFKKQMTIKTRLFKIVNNRHQSYKWGQRETNNLFYKWKGGKKWRVFYQAQVFSPCTRLTCVQQRRRFMMMEDWGQLLQIVAPGPNGAVSLTTLSITQKWRNVFFQQFQLSSSSPHKLTSHQVDSLRPRAWSWSGCRDTAYVFIL